MDIKLNLGCGEKHLLDHINVDKYGTPDILCNLEEFPWPWEDNSVSGITMNHVLEHLGQTPDIFINIFKELYRISKPDSTVTIVVPHPRHDDFLNDPTHVRPVTMETIQLFSKKFNAKCKKNGAANTPLGIYHNVDFEIIDGSLNLDQIWNEKMEKEGLSNDKIILASNSMNNVIREIVMVVKVIKS